ncbi:MAG: hypothetical protein JWO06_2211 [Bacteroidota bacterium]|nr:hypothetical protein [Bacteroidota bacterium]
MNRTSAYIGIAGALGMAASDIMLLGAPVSGHEYDLSSFGAMAHVASFRAEIASTFGLVCAFFICFGFWFLKRKFEVVNEKLSMVLFISMCSMMFFAGAFHAGYYFISFPGMWVSLGEVNPIPVNILNDFRNHLEVLSYLGVPGFVVGTVLFFKLASDKRFPAWLKFCNPLVLCGVFLGLLYFLPAPVGGYLRPAFINLGTAVVFIASLLVEKEVL